MCNLPGKTLTSTGCKSSRLRFKAPFSNHSVSTVSSTIPSNNLPATGSHQQSVKMQSRSSSCMRRVSSTMLLLALLAAAAASVSARPSRQLLGGKSGDFSSLIDSTHAAMESLLTSKAEQLLHKKQKLHTGKSQLPLAIHMDQQIPAVNPNPSNPPMILANPSQPPVLLPATEVKHSKHDKKVKHAKFDFESKFDHKFDHEDLLQLPVPAVMTSLPNPSQPPMPLPASTKLSKHDKKALKMQLNLAAKLVKDCDDDKFDHDKKDKHDKHSMKVDQVIPAAVNPNPSNPPLILANPSQPPVLLPAAHVKAGKLSKHAKKALKAAAKLAKAHGVDIDKAAGVSVADVVMRKEPKFDGPSLLG
ncbi:hypothetical protein OEZ86_003354 [Tetradesmus obliquus]|nr:hypothetical protein OEZ86_003354 [Tetradesmus obliquus]